MPNMLFFWLSPQNQSRKAGWKIKIWKTGYKMGPLQPTLQTTDMKKLASKPAVNMQISMPTPLHHFNLGIYFDLRFGFSVEMQNFPLEHSSHCSHYPYLTLCLPPSRCCSDEGRVIPKLIWVMYVHIVPHQRKGRDTSLSLSAFSFQLYTSEGWFGLKKGKKKRASGLKWDGRQKTSRGSCEDTWSVFIQLLQADV